MEPQQLNPAGSPPDDDARSSLDTLESNTPETGQNQPLVAPSVSPTLPEAPKRVTLITRATQLASHINVYLLLFALIVVLVFIAFFLILQANRRQQNGATPGSQGITQDTLDKLKNSDVSVGDVKQTLNIESNAIFAGNVLIRKGLEVAGPIKVGGSLSLNGLTVAGTTNLDQIQANGLSVNGNSSVQGLLSVQKTLTVAGGGSFGGELSASSISTNTLKLLQDLQINRHVTTSGGKPASSNGGALGSGGTATVAGTDTAGNFTANTGTGPPAGCFATISFAQAYGSTPHVTITPANAASASLSYYVNRSNTTFSVCTASAPGAGQTYSFDYIVIN